MKSLAQMIRYFSCCVALISSSLVSAQVAVAPIRVELTDARATASVTIANDSDRTMTMQPTLMRWTQDGSSGDQLVASRDIVVAPPLIEIGPKQRQVVRVALRSPASADVERTYRLVVREVPQQNADGTGPVLKFALNLSIPIFVLPKADIKVAPKVLLAGKMASNPSRLVLDITNSGTAHVQAREIRFIGEAPPTGYNTMFYLLPGATKRLDVPVSPAALVQLATLKQLSYEIVTSTTPILGVVPIN